jgi:hypothetical protein
MARPQAAGGTAAANILNTQSRTADKGWSSSLGLGRGAKTPHINNLVMKISKTAPDLNLWVNDVRKWTQNLVRGM